MSDAGTIDFAIVGAGAAGSLLAAKLAKAGHSVVILEAGPPWEMGDLISSQIWSRRLRWGGPFVASEGEGPIAFGFNAGWGVGGAALHHYGTWPRLKPEDFACATHHGRGVDWPIGYDELRPFYDDIQKEVGISGDAEAEVWRPAGAPYPMPPLTRFKQADVLARGFHALGKRTAPAPLAINSVPYNDRAACLYDGWCDAGCPITALANPQATYLAQAREAGVQIVAHADVSRVRVAAADMASGVEYAIDGAARFQPARNVILAASVVGNPGILLRSTSEHHPRGIGNAHDLVGRFVMTHGLLMTIGLFADETEPHRGVTGASLICHDNYRKDSTAGAFGSRQWLIAPSIKPNDLAGLANADAGLYGARLDTFMRKAVRHAGNMVGMIEEMPDRDNRVTLTETGGTRLTHRFDAEAKALWAAHRAEGEAVFKAAGATEVWSSKMNSAHLMGGTRMGKGPADSVTDSFGRVHGMRNLWVAGGGLFPTSGAANPTFTIHALALRTAREMLRQARA